MALTEEDIKKLREAFTTCTRPVVLFDDDADGLTSFLMLYNHVKDGKGIPVKSSPKLGADFARMVNDYSPDLVVILDMPMVDQEFLDKIPARKIWLDHHPILERKNVEYYNPRRENPEDNRPTSYWMYKIMQKPLWIAMCGIVADWSLPEKEMREEFEKEYPGLLPLEVTRPEVAIHDTPLAKLIMALAFNLKGRTQEVIKSVKVLTRIKDPYEILKQESPAGRFIYKKFKKLDEEYQQLLKEVKASKNDKMIIFKYKSANAVSYSTELSNAIIYKHPDKFVIVAWEYNGEYKCSLRTTMQDLTKIIPIALKGVRGYGGGHAHAGGSCVHIDDFDQYVENIRREL
ncbi:hypothetical protein JW711_00915 [Candidatus Woesearchaeota archaeon]|nr:hypothetical protein [Candidatus Woesearchaeota archaeon]